MELALKELCPNGLAEELAVDPDWPWEGLPSYRHLSKTPGSGSGGYAYHVISSAMHQSVTAVAPTFVAIKLVLPLL